MNKLPPNMELTGSQTLEANSTPESLAKMQENFLDYKRLGEQRLKEVSLISRLYLSGMTCIDRLHENTRIPRSRILQIIREHALRTLAEEHSYTIIDQIFTDKLPILSSIRDKTLLLLEREINKRLNQDKNYTTKEISELCSLLTQIDKIARLEKGTPTDITETIKSDPKDPKIIELAQTILSDPIRNLDADLNTSIEFQIENKQEEDDETF